ncbi:hypothetical protein [Calycomorphotria hydatis]|uniref:Uncharacterized protein n=1 Tax=Calycomorphotria hydatis TaxID=2528027 RepID=A0A517TBJ4_9PLAN|nr:hypothetical protein [Calycomorphotria hydatis]QDT65745.1 hypothetical protein V22_30050 [Calycomorphotria hydatis]
MVMTSRNIWGLVFAACIIATPITLTGCGGGRSQEIPVGTNKLTNISRLRQSLEFNVELGEVGSEAEVLPEQIDALKEDGVSDEKIAKLHELSEKLLSAPAGAAVKSAAKEMLAALPEEQANTLTE